MLSFLPSAEASDPGHMQHTRTETNTHSTLSRVAVEAHDAHGTVTTLTALQADI